MNMKRKLPPKANGISRNNYKIEFVYEFTPGMIRDYQLHVLLEIFSALIKH